MWKLKFDDDGIDHSDCHSYCEYALYMVINLWKKNHHQNSI